MPRLINGCLHGIVSIFALARGQKTGKGDRPRKKGAVVKARGQEMDWPLLESILYISKCVQPSEQAPSCNIWDLWRVLAQEVF